MTAPGWQSIDTAPRDGTRVLGYMPSKSGGYVRCIWWDAEFESDGWDDDAGEPAFRSAWTAGEVAHWGYEEYAEAHPSHWMPLPAPPEPSA